jgi:hypothetical protein
MTGDRPPAADDDPASFMNAGEGVGALIALRVSDGLGQHIDVPSTAMMMTTVHHALR